MAGSGSVRVERLTPARQDDYLRFFDHERGPAFADNPEWATCYCHFYEVPPALDWKGFDGPMNRAAMAARIATGEMEGYLAYDGGEVVGWMNAQPYPKLRHACARLRIPSPPLPVPPHEAAAIVCFVVAPTRRRQGIARALLAAGAANLAARGLALVDAFPWNTEPGDTSAADHYHGSLPMFTQAGFVPIAAHENVTVVRKTLR
ncbi:MAG: GNAT family N-acetyltransferase [Betaproteobacteria bacterium]|nr:GNAT family N-acetyltransferase [Betaproteobacteria bacterium]MCC7216809.1 GNAT family N-acetyltransferase [Burkholderiales bacterium]